LPTTAYTATGVAQWPTNGIVSAGKHNVSTNIVCDPNPIATQTPCPELNVNNGCAAVLTTIGTAVNITHGDCFDVNHTTNGQQGANGIFISCSTGPLSGLSSCLRELKHPNFTTAMRMGSCNDNNGNNTTFFFAIPNSGGNPAPSGRNIEIEGIVPSVYAINNSDLNYECVADWPQGSTWTEQCRDITNGSTVISIKPGVNPAPFTGNPNIQCKLKIENGNNW